MSNSQYDSLKLENQLCFPLYVAAKETIRLYKPFLDELDLTYTQYITMMLLWEHSTMTVKELGDRLYLDSGTLTPLLKKLEKKGFITRTRSYKDERNLDISLTAVGMELRDKALKVPREMAKCVKLTNEEAYQLYTLIYKLIKQ
ncbi:MAG: MarR family transcriptional regulator [Ruminococcus sp.]|nr:MarR family transcriptional regulator [Ruminococcus sp.]